MNARFLVADVFDGLASLPDNSVDFVLSSPPFLALRSYLPPDHPDKAKEIGSEPTPADYLDRLLDVVEVCDRVLAPHGSLVFELGDTYSGSGGAGGDYGNPDKTNARRDAPSWAGSAAAQRRAARPLSPRPKYAEVGNEDGRRNRPEDEAAGILQPRQRGGPSQRDSVPGWPLDKSLCGIPTLFAWSLAYGRNLLRPERPTERWRVRNLVAWYRPNPPVGALSDKFRPATSFLTVACKSAARYWDGEAVRERGSDNTHPRLAQRDSRGRGSRPNEGKAAAPERGGNFASLPIMDSDGTRPPPDTWEIPTQPYKGSHYATFPEALCVRPIKAMCPERVCTVCGEPSRRVTEAAGRYAEHLGQSWADRSNGRPKQAGAARTHHAGQPIGAPHIKGANYRTVGWTDCGHNSWRTGVVLDPFAGSGTTLAVATGHGRDAIGIDLDSRNADLARERVGMWLEVVELDCGVAL